MKALIQRVTNAKVHINGITKGSINKGLVIFIGFADSDTFEKVEWIVKKIAKLRIFTDQEGKMNNSVEDVQGELLIISQFTLYASVKKGTRPSFIEAAEPILAENIYNYFELSITYEKDIHTPIHKMKDYESFNTARHKCKSSYKWNNKRLY